MVSIAFLLNSDVGFQSRTSSTMVDSSRDWAVEMLDVDFSTPLPANASAVCAFLKGDTPKHLPAHPTLLHKLLADGDTMREASDYLRDCGTAQELATTVGYVSNYYVAIL